MLRAGLTNQDDGIQHRFGLSTWYIAWRQAVLILVPLTADSLHSCLEVLFLFCGAKRYRHFRNCVTWQKRIGFKSDRIVKFTNDGNGPTYLGLAAPFPGKVIPIHLQTSGTLLAKPLTFLARSVPRFQGNSASVYVQPHISVSFLLRLLDPVFGKRLKQNPSLYFVLRTSMRGRSRVVCLHLRGRGCPETSA